MTDKVRSSRLEPAVLVRNLRKRYKDVEAVAGLDLEVRTGECFGLLGPNGAGKTTTIEICEGLLEPDSGEVEVLGLRWEADSGELRQRLGIQLQETQLADKLTVFETLRPLPQLLPSGTRRGGCHRARPALGKAATRAWERSRADRSNGWPWRAHSWAIRICSSSTSRPPVSTRRPGDSSGISSSEFKLRGTNHSAHHALHGRSGTAVRSRGDHGPWRIIALGILASSSLRPEASTSWSSHPQASAGLDIAGFHRIDGVRNVRTEDHGVLVHVSELHSAVPALLQELARQGVALTELRTHSASLEDVFVGLTGRHLREE